MKRLIVGTLVGTLGVGALALLAACDPTAMPDNSAYVAGFNPPPPDPGMLVVASPVIKDLKPGTDVTYCSYLAQTVTAMTDIVDFKAYQSLTGHHLLLTTAIKPQAPNTHVCTEDDMVNIGTFAGGGGAEGMSNFKGIPAGIAFRLQAGAQFMLQTHWVNAGTSTVDGQGVMYLKANPASNANIPADQFLADTETWTIPAGATSEATTECKFKQDVSFFQYSGHMHEWGKHITLDLLQTDGTLKNLYNVDWLPEYMTNPPTSGFSKDSPFVIHAGETVRVRCQWKNDTAKDILFPKEMCYFVGYYFTSQGSLDCSEGVWPL